jgi:pullulanase/glycogen debranching enzyme
MLASALFSLTAALPLQACDAPAFATTLHAAPAALEARAVWLDRRRAQWPGMVAEGRFRLYHSPLGAIVARAGAKVQGAAGSLGLGLSPAQPTERFNYLPAGPILSLADADLPQLAQLHREQLVLVREDEQGTVLAATRLQAAGALDDLYPQAQSISDLGATPGASGTAFTLWAPTAQQAAVCIYDKASSAARTIHPLAFDAHTGAWRTQLPGDLSGRYYTYVLDVVADGSGLVRNRVTDPYSVSLNTDSQRSYIARLDAANLKPPGWDAHRTPDTVKAQADMSVYELHVRDFSRDDASVPAAKRGKYTAFSETNSNGMRHLKALAQAGLTDIHLLPVYDIASVPERGCALPKPAGAPHGEQQQALVMRTAHTDCYNWGYDPWHYNAPEGSYASDPQDGARRIVELREMVMNLHRAGLRVGMDVVYNHTFAAGQQEKSVLDRIVPGYYHRLDAAGKVAQSTCCDNTATENAMMAKLMIDSAVLWARHYRMDSFRFDLMGHQPRAAMERLQAAVNAATGRSVQLIGEGWNFGEVESGARFVQASQLSLNGSGIGTFSDRARDAARGGGAGDAGEAVIKQQGYINGLVYDANAKADQRPRADLLKAADLVRVGLAGTLRSYPMQTFDGVTRKLEDIDYGGQPAGYASAPGETVNYVENHDNQTLYDANALKLPLSTTTEDRARVQILGLALTAFSQGVAYFHAGSDILRSKSLDRNSFNSGDWFNRVDWRYRTNHFGTGLPPAPDNAKDWPLFKPLLANPKLRPQPEDIAFARDAFRDLLAIRASSTLFRLRTADEVAQRLRFFNVGPEQEPTVIAAHLDGRNYPGAGFASIRYFVNVDKIAHAVTDNAARGRHLRLHPVLTAAGAGDKRAAQASFDSTSGNFSIPPRTALVFVED